MIIVLQLAGEVHNVWDVNHPTTGLNFEHEWKLVRDNVLREAEQHGFADHDPDEIIYRMERMGWVFDRVAWQLVQD